MHSLRLHGEVFVSYAPKLDRRGGCGQFMQMEKRRFKISINDVDDPARIGRMLQRLCVELDDLQEVDADFAADLNNAEMPKGTKGTMTAVDTLLLIFSTTALPSVARVLQTYLTTRRVKLSVTCDGREVRLEGPSSDETIKHALEAVLSQK